MQTLILKIITKWKYYVAFISCLRIK